MRILIAPIAILIGCGTGAGAGGSGGAAGQGSGGRASGGTGATDASGRGGATDAHFTDTGGSDAPPIHMQSVYMTFYGWPDNSPPGGAIAYGKSDGFPTVHDTAGGAGTYDDPITFATDQAEFPPGTRLYAPVVEKYLIMEDDCAECDTDWASSGKWHIDVWMNSNGTDDSNAVLACEDHWTQTTTVVEVNPPAGRPATAPPLFDPTTNVCRTSP
jgi:3D (Asp-Asp-Asp) domain-containing protein